MCDPRSKLQRILLDYPQVRLAIMFGSVAAGTANKDSDLDLALLANARLDKALRMDLMARIGRELGRPVDLVDMRTAGVVLLSEIFKGERLIGTSTAFAEQLSRYLVDREDFLPLRRRILKERRLAWIG